MGASGGVVNGNITGHLPPPLTTPPAPPQPPSNNGASIGTGPGPNGSSSNIRYTTPQVSGTNVPANNGQAQNAAGLPGINGASGCSANVASGGTLNGQRNSQERKLPAKARVKQARVPNAYDKTALRLDVSICNKVAYFFGDWHVNRENIRWNLVVDDDLSFASKISYGTN